MKTDCSDLTWPDPDKGDGIRNTERFKTVKPRIKEFIGIKCSEKAKMTLSAETLQLQHGYKDEVAWFVLAFSLMHEEDEDTALDLIYELIAVHPAGYIILIRIRTSPYEVVILILRLLYRSQKKKCSKGYDAVDSFTGPFVRFLDSLARSVCPPLLLGSVRLLFVRPCRSSVLLMCTCLTDHERERVDEIV